MDTQTENRPAASSSCRKKVKDDNATFLANLKDHMNEFVHASMDEHKTCFKNTMNKMFGLSKVVVAEKKAEAKEVESHSPLQAHHQHLHHHPKLSLAKSSRQSCSEWIFRDVPSDITIEVNGGNFGLHKFLLVSRSGRIRRIVAEHRDADISKVELLNLPGGAETFELAAKFCYRINFEITSSNVAQLFCVPDYLEMT